MCCSSLPGVQTRMFTPARAKLLVRAVICHCVQQSLRSAAVLEVEARLFSSSSVCCRSAGIQ